MSEWRGWVQWAWRWILLLLFLSSAAYVFAYLCSPADQVFLGFLANNDDNQVYVSFMREGAQGAWLTTIRFTPEAHRPALLLPLYQVLGKIARVLGLPNELTFHLARLLGGIALLATAYWFSTLCLPGGAARRSAFLMICFSAGFGWLLVLIGLADRAIVPVDIRVPEASTFLTLFTSPHFVLGVTFQLLTFMFYLRAERHRWCLLGAATSLLLLSITLVYNVIVVSLVLGSYALVRCWQERRLWIPELWQTVIVGILPAPVILYYYVLFRFDPFWSVAYGQHDIVHTPHPLALVLGYGLVFWLAVWGLGVWTRRRRWSPPRILLVVWVVGNGLLLYAPLAFQGKLAAGWHVGLCLMAAVGLHGGLLPWLHRCKLPSWFGSLAVRSQDLLSAMHNVVLILTIPSTLLVALIGFRVALTEHYFPYFLPIEDVEAVAWLSAHADEDDVLLSSYAIANYFVAHSDARSFLGHQFAVIDPQGKDRVLRRIYSGAAPMKEQRALVTSYGITFVFHGLHEHALGSFDPANVPWLVQVYRKGGTALYRVEGEE